MEMASDTVLKYVSHEGILLFTYVPVKGPALVEDARR